MNDEWPKGWKEHQEAQRRRWLALTPEQRLRWLEMAKDFARRFGGAASPIPRQSNPPGSGD